MTCQLAQKKITSAGTRRLAYEPVFILVGISFLLTSNNGWS